MNGKFNERGDRYTLYDKATAFPLYNYHFNKDYYTTIANDLSGDGMGFDPDKRIYTRGERFALVKDGDVVWSVGSLGSGSIYVSLRIDRNRRKRVGARDTKKVQIRH